MPSPGGRRRRPARSGRPRLRRDHPTTLRLQADEDLFRRGGPTEVVALPDLAAQLAERHCRLLVLDALGDDAQTEVARQGDGRLDDDEVVIVKSTIALARDLGLRIVAEGIEDEETAVALRELGCEIGQGYHLGRPTTPEQILIRLQTQGRWMIPSQARSS